MHNEDVLTPLKKKGKINEYTIDGQCYIKLEW